MPASFSGRSASEIWFTPYDEVSLDLEARYVDLCVRCKGPSEENWYSLALQSFFDATSGQIDRGLDAEMTLDYTQWMTPTERRLGQTFVAKEATYISSGKFLVGTSPQGVIDHLKGKTWNAQKNSYEVPDGDFDTVDEAMDAGYPVTWLGSWNPSIGGSKQFNCIIIMPGKILSADFRSKLAQIRAHIVSAEKPAYNPWLVKPSGETEPHH
jgi:hypothetical protein